MNASNERYDSGAIALHWLMALFIVGAFSLGLTMTDMPGITPTKLKYYNWHKWIGVTVLALAAVRALWRIAHAVPPLPASIPRWQQQISGATHLLLYVLIFAVPLSGYFYSLAAGFKVVYLGMLPLPVLIDPNPALKPILKAVHFWLNMGMAGLVLMHVAAALKHHLIDRDNVLLRMLPRLRKWWRKEQSLL
jgi:cytochrome b561